MFVYFVGILSGLDDFILDIISAWPIKDILFFFKETHFKSQICFLTFRFCKTCPGTMHVKKCQKRIYVILSMTFF